MGCQKWHRLCAPIFLTYFWWWCAMHTVSFDWFQSGLVWIPNLEFCFLKLLIFYQKLLWNIRSRLNFSTFWVFEPVFKYVFCREYGSIMTNSIYWPVKQCLKMRIEIRVIWQCLSLSFEETWEINIAKKEFSNTVLWVWMVLAWFCRKNVAEWSWNWRTPF